MIRVMELTSLPQGPATHPSIRAARADLLDAFWGVEMSPAEQRTVAWLLDWDQPTLHTLAAVIRRAREQGPRGA